MLYYSHQQEHADAVYGLSLLRYYPSVAYSLLPVVTEMLLDPVVKSMVDFEQYATEVCGGFP